MSIHPQHHLPRRTIEDPGPARPQDRTPDLTGRTGGFGWPMIQHLAREVTIAQTRDGTGKAITATLPR
ncbi:ATP-binding protein [Streptomyces fagopyri]|uniref:ATP-binding protein n=1 Tax=Streptomyces fagopyri TaxID=2662397 RepID=UPI003F4D265E